MLNGGNRIVGWFVSYLVMVFLSNKYHQWEYLWDEIWMIRGNIFVFTIGLLICQESLKIAFYSFFEISAVVGVSVSNYNLVQYWIKFGIRGYYALCFIIYDPIRWFVFDYIWILSNIIKILIIRCDPVC